MSRTEPCSPGSHPHSDRPNWSPATTIDEYLQNCREGIESYSERRAAKLLGWSRTLMWRAKHLQAIPPDLFELLVESNCPIRELAIVGRMIATGHLSFETSLCPHCGGVLRIRGSLRDQTLAVIRTWEKVDRRVAA